MEPVESKICAYNSTNKLIDAANIGLSKQNFVETLYKAVMYGVIFVVWFAISKHYNNELLLPAPAKTIAALGSCLVNAEIMANLLLTIKRVLLGFLIAFAIGVPLGFSMGYFKSVEKLIGGLIDSVRQVPIMAWVPLTIVWFGIGDGPTLFLIAITGVFPIILNTIEGVKNISKDYYNAARSMGASPWSIFADIIVPATIPSILTGSRIAISSGWMSVICAEFIATSAGLGFSMIEAQTRMETDVLIALMILSAIVGYLIDRTIMFANKSLTKWRFVE